MVDHGRVGVALMRSSLRRRTLASCRFVVVLSRYGARIYATSLVVGHMRLGLSLQHQGTIFTSLWSKLPP